MTYLYIFIGGGLGSMARYGVGKLSKIVVNTDFPLGTLIANLLACTIVALLINAYPNKTEDQSWMIPMILIGFCGGFSTFSAFSNDTFELFDSGNYLYAAMNILISVAFGIGIIYLLRAKTL